MLLSYGPARYGPILSARCSPPPAAPGLSDPRPSAARAAGTPRSGDGKSRVWAASPIPVCRSLVGNAAAAVNRLPVPVSESRGRSYLISTVAPASSSCFLIFAASSLLTPSLIGLVAASTRSFASLRPRLVIARTSLMTLIFLSPAAARMPSNSVFSGAASAAGAAAAPPAAATATGADAETPHFSSSIFESCAASITVKADRSSTSCAKSAILPLLILGSGLITIRRCRPLPHPRLPHAPRQRAPAGLPGPAAPPQGGRRGRTAARRARRRQWSAFRYDWRIRPRPWRPPPDRAKRRSRWGR